MPREAVMRLHTGSYSSQVTRRLNGMTSLSLGFSGVCLCVEYIMAAQSYCRQKSSQMSCDTVP